MCIFSDIPISFSGNAVQKSDPNDQEVSGPPRDASIWSNSISASPGEMHYAHSQILKKNKTDWPVEVWRSGTDPPKLFSGFHLILTRNLFFFS